jgi:hypothetical protein
MTFFLTFFAYGALTIITTPIVILNYWCETIIPTMLSPFTVLWLGLALLLTWSAPSVTAQAVRNKKRKEEKQPIVSEQIMLQDSNAKQENSNDKNESPINTKEANPKNTGIRGSPVGFIECNPTDSPDAGFLCRDKCIPSSKSSLGGLCEPNQLERLTETVHDIARQLKGKMNMGGKKKNNPTKRNRGNNARSNKTKPKTKTRGNGSTMKKTFKFGIMNGNMLIHSRNGGQKRRGRGGTGFFSPVYSPVFSPVFSPIAAPTPRPTPRPTPAPTPAPIVAKIVCEESCVSAPGVVVAADQSCNGSSNLIVGCGSCNIAIIGDYIYGPCAYSPSMQVGSGSCLYPDACGSSEGAVIGDESCLGYDTCSFAPDARIGDRSCDGAASCYANEGFLERVSIGNDSCNGFLACTTQNGSMGVTIGSNSCNCDTCCYNLGDECYVPDNRCNTVGDCNFNNTAGGCPEFN